MSQKNLKLSEVNQFPPFGNPAGDRIPGLSMEYTVFPEELLGEDGKPVKENGQAQTTANLYDLVVGKDSTEDTRSKYVKLLEKCQPDLVELAADIMSTKGAIHEVLVAETEGGNVLWSGCRRYLAYLYLWVKGKTEPEIPARPIKGKDEALELIGNSANNYVPPSLVDRGHHFLRLKKSGFNNTDIAKTCLAAKFARSKQAALQEVSRGLKLAEHLPERMAKKVRSGELRVTKAEEWVDKQLNPKKKATKKPARFSKKFLSAMFEDEDFFRKQFCTTCPIETVEKIREFISFLLDSPYQTLAASAEEPSTEPEEV